VEQECGGNDRQDEQEGGCAKKDRSEPERAGTDARQANQENRPDRMPLAADQLIGVH
jgi:hypothetical protein